jgi:hypothetical protein
LYEPACGAAKVATAAVIESPGSPLVLTTELPDHQFRGGTLKWGNEQRLIIDNLDHQVTLSWPIPGLPVGATVHLYPGCSHTLSESTGCASFNNTARYGGFPRMPSKDPYNTTIF